MLVTPASVSTDIEAVKPGRPGVVEDALHQNLVAHCWLRVVRHLSAGCSSRRAQRSTSGSQHARAGRIGGRHPKVHGWNPLDIGGAVGSASAPAQRSRPSARARAAASVRLGRLQLVEDVTDMLLNGVYNHHKLVCDLLVGLPGCD